MAAERRFFVPPEDLRDGATVPVRGTEHHHLSRVLRLRAGDEVSVFDGVGRGFTGVIERVGKAESLVRLTSRDDCVVEPALELTLAQAVPHHEKMELIVQKATELGVAAIVPILARRTVVRPAPGPRWQRLARWRRVALEASRQSGRLRVPEVAEPRTWDDFLAGQTAAPGHARLILCPARPGAGAEGPTSTGPTPTSAVIAVGPEGGWTGAEIALATARGFERLALGPRTLRAETAGIVGTALVLFLSGDLGGSPAGWRAG